MKSSGCVYLDLNICHGEAVEENKKLTKVRDRDTNETERLTQEISFLKDLIQHCWIHSGYPDCGYQQMTTEQKAAFDNIVKY